MRIKGDCPIFGGHLRHIAIASFLDWHQPHRLKLLEMNRLIAYRLYFLLLIVIPQALSAICPTVTMPLAGSTSVCSGGVIDLPAQQTLIGIDDPANPALTGIAWFSDAALTQTLNSAVFNFTGFNTCDAQIITVYVALLCNEQAQPIAAGELTVSVFPQPPSPIQTSDCQLTVSDVVCGGTLIIEYLQPDNNWASVPAINPPFDGATALWRAYIAGAPDLNADGFPDCLRTGTTTATDCPCIPPPAPSATSTDTLITCANTPNNDAFTASASVGASINWYNAANILVATGNSFTPIIPTTYYAIAVSPNGICSSSPTWFVLQTEPTADATFSYPTVSVCVGDASFLPNTVITAGGTFEALGGLTIDATTGAITPNIAGTFLVSHTIGGNCPDIDLELVTIAACCPTVTVPLSATYAMCDGITPPNFTNYENDISYSDTEGNFVGLAWFSDIGLNLPLTPAAYAHTGINTCLAETRTVYLGVICATQPNAIAAGSLTITVYPTPDIAVLQPVGGCSLQMTENCVGTLTIQYEQANGTWATTLPDLTPAEGQTVVWQAFVPNTPDNNADAVPDCLVSGTVMAVSCNCVPPPTPVAVTDTITACAGTANFQSFLVQVPSSAFVIWRNEAGDQVGTGNSLMPTVAGVYYAQSASIADTCLGGQISAYYLQSPLSDATFAYSDVVFCADGNTITPTISGNAGGVFSASGGLAINSQTGAIALTQSGNYNITYSAGLACPAETTVSLLLNNNTMFLSAGIDVAVCAGDTVQLNGVATDATFLAWSGSGTFVQIDNDTTGYIPSVAGTFDLVLTVQSGCGVLQQDTVRVISQPTIEFSVLPADTIIAAGTGVLLQADGVGNIVWEDDPTLTCTHCSQTVAFPTQTTTYTVYSLEQCVLPQVVTVTVVPPQPIIPPDTLVVANAFSPNNDGINDEFIPQISGEVLSYHLQVFNRWGSLLFDTDIPQYGWDGTTQGKYSDLGAYAYRITYQLVGKEPQVLTGYTVLLR